MSRIADNHISVDCVVMGFDGEDLNVLLVKRTGEENGELFHDMKLPGGLIYVDENLDEAARRILFELTGIDNVDMKQFKAYGSAHRTDNPKDVHWLENAVRMKITRIVTVAYIAAVRIDEELSGSLKGSEAVWMKVNHIPQLAFDHNIIVSEALEHLKATVFTDDSMLFSILPSKFTVLQFRLLLETMLGEKIDNSNIYKKIAITPYIVPLDEKEKGMTHRAARYFRFDCSIWEKTRKKGYLKR